MGRNRPIPTFETWQAVTNGFGKWIIVDQDGLNPLEHPDRLVRIHAVWMAAQAPPLLVAVKELTRTVRYLTAGGFHGFVPLLEFASMTINLAHPPVSIIEHAAPLRDQGELDLEAA